jgi:uncharacterized protein YndB with AHSA1/START domain
MTAIPEGDRPRSTHRVDHGARATLVVRRFVRHPPNVVWEAITNPDEVRQWFLTEAKVDGRVGGRVEMTTGSYRVHATGPVLSWDPPNLYEYGWNVPPGPTLPEGEKCVVRWELRAAQGGTLITLTYRDLTRRTAGVYRAGLEAFLDRLEAQLDGRPLPDWETRIRELRGSTTDWT